jgi:hypothetical protein
MKTPRFIFAALIAFIGLALPARAATPSTSVHAILIAASKEKGPADKRLAAYEAELQRNFPESTFRLVSESNATATGSTPANFKFGGDTLGVEATKTADGISLKMRWLKNGVIVIDTTVMRPPGVPALLVHRPADDRELSIVLVIAK